MCFQESMIILWTNIKVKPPQILHEQQCCVLVMTAHVKCVKFVLCVTDSLQMFKSPVTLLTGLLHIQKFMKTNKKRFQDDN